MKIVRMKVLDNIKKYSKLLLLGSLVVFCLFLLYKKNAYENEIAALHTKLSIQYDTIEIHKNLYRKSSVELENLDSLLKSMEKESARDKQAIDKLREEIKKRDEKIASVNRVALTWKKRYEDFVDARQDEVDGPDNKRIKVSFEKNFGYIGVEGWTLTDPPEAWVSIFQNRPLKLTLAMTQNKDGNWTTVVASSEDNINVDVEISAVNSYIARKKWYEKISLDLGLDVQNTVYPFAGVSYPFENGITLSGGVWGDWNVNGYYTTFSYSWRPFN